MKKWEAPKLIVLVRSQPEESLILNCKGALPGPQGVATYCMTMGDGCLNCQQYSTS